MYIQTFLDGYAIDKKTKINDYKVEYSTHTMCDVVRVIDPEINENGFTFYLYLTKGWAAAITNDYGEIVRILDKNLEELEYE